MNQTITNVDEYIGQYDDPVRSRLMEMRRTVLELAPSAVESISYGMPAYKLAGKPLVYFAGFPGHIGFYATPNGHVAFSKEFAPYKQGKGSVQFPHDEPLPLDLVRRVVEFRVGEVAKG